MNRRVALSRILGSSAVVPLAGSFAASRAVAAGATLEPLALASGWLGTRPSRASLRGRVVLVDVFTFECVNCRRVTPNLERLRAAYASRDLAIVAVHTPEVPSYQSRLAYLAAQTRAAGIAWPVAIDSGYRIWNAYGISAWPTQLLFDRTGRLRATIVGDGRDRDVDAAVASLVARH